MEILEWLCAAVYRIGLELRPIDWILHHDNAPAHKVLAVKQFLAQKSITEMGHPPYPRIWLQMTSGCFRKKKSAIKGRRFQDTDNGTQSYSATGVGKMFPAVAASLG
jgi:hypothetical protein